MVTLDLQPTRVGARITLTADDYSGSISTDRSRAEVEQIVRDLCRVAGLPAPWKS